MTASQFKYLYETANPNGHFFDRSTMKFFGDTMSNYGVRKVRKGGRELYELYRRKPVKHGLRTSAWFDAKTFERVYDVDDTPGVKTNPAAPVDPVAARELELHILNSPELYRRAILPAIANLRKKVARGVYRPELAVKLFEYVAKAGADDYSREFGKTQFSPATRREVARTLLDHYEEEIEPSVKRNPSSDCSIRFRSDMPGSYAVKRGRYYYVRDSMRGIIMSENVKDAARMSNLSARLLVNSHNGRLRQLGTSSANFHVVKL